MKEQGRPLNANSHLCPPADEKELLSLQKRFKIRIIPQYHRMGIGVPVGWLHQVINLQPCIKVAWEFMETNQAASIPTNARLISKHFGSDKCCVAQDYLPAQSCGLQIALLSNITSTS